MFKINLLLNPFFLNGMDYWQTDTYEIMEPINSQDVSSAEILFGGYSNSTYTNFIDGGISSAV